MGREACYAPGGAYAGGAGRRVLRETSSRQLTAATQPGLVADAAGHVERSLGTLGFSGCAAYAILASSRGVAQLGSAPAWGAGGRWFESSLPDQSSLFLYEDPLVQRYRIDFCPSANLSVNDNRDDFVGATVHRDRQPGSRDSPAAQFTPQSARRTRRLAQGSPTPGSASSVS